MKLATQIKDVMASIEAMLIIGLGLIWFVSPSVAGGGQVTARLAEAGFTVVNSGYDQGLGARLTSPGDLIRTLRIPEVTNGICPGFARFALTSPWLVGKQTIGAAGAVLLFDNVGLESWLLPERR